MHKYIFLLSCLIAAWPSAGQAAGECPPGVYTNDTAQAVVYERVGGDGETAQRYQLVDGRRGTLGTGEAALRCRGERLLESESGELEYRELQETDTRFRSGALWLAGRLIEPVTASGSQRPLVVFVHGSERTPTVGRSIYPYLLAAQGVSVFAFDKRGTGASAGDYTQDFHALAADVVAASVEARQLAAGRYDRFGLFGGSQGGWVAPLAANRAGADFVVVGFGLVLSPLEEDAEQVYDELRRMGYGAAAVRKAREVTGATGRVVASGFVTGFDDLEAVKEKFGGEPWFDDIEGEFTGTVLRASGTELASGSPGEFRDLEVPWRYDAEGALRALDIPQLWVIAGEDTVAPGLLTQRRLAGLQAEGYPIATALFPDTDHGMFEFVEHADGSRTMTRITEGYFRLIADYMKGEASGPYGAARIVPPPSSMAERAAAANATSRNTGTVPRSVVLFIGDGASLSYWTAARFADRPLAVERMAEIGLVDTRPHEPSSGRVTDSAAGATAYATGVRTFNGAVAVGPDAQPVQTVLERAEALGMATGLVATSAVTDATPAAFASHVVDRTQYQEIARQMAAVELEVLMGGGQAYFDGSQDGWPDLLEGMRERYTVAEDPATLAVQAARVDALLGLFARGPMPPAPERSPTLAAMTGAALEVLDNHPDGFFLMVEGSQIDWRGHANAPLDEVVAEVLDLDRAIAVALEYRLRRPETLVLVLADHDSGGLALHPGKGAAETAPLEAHYTTLSDTTAGHTASMVPLFADGPGAERFGTIIDNAEVGRRLRALIEDRPRKAAVRQEGRGKRSASQALHSRSACAAGASLSSP